MEFTAGSDLMIIDRVVNKLEGVAATYEHSLGHKVSSSKPINSVNIGIQFLHGYNCKAT